ncbi:MAG: putative nucleotidyltransferase substrate binding domain-containing protein, partial [Hyphomicrobiaceae bacterium]
RVLALRHNIPDRSTPGRLHAAKQHMPEQAHVAEALIEAHKILLGTVLRQQLRDLDRGLALSNAVRPGELTKHQTQELRWALEQVPEVPNLLGTPLFAV